MSGNNRILSLLGLALRGGRLAVGEEPAALAAKAGQSRLLLTASDAAGNTLRRAEHLAEEGHCLWLALPFTKAELGGALGRGSAAVAALTDTGLAAALTERLKELDPERYGEAAARMDLKRRRAKERAAAPHRDPPKKAPPPKQQRRASGPPRDGERRPPRDRQGPGPRKAQDRRAPGGQRAPEERRGRPQGFQKAEDRRAAPGGPRNGARKPRPAAKARLQGGGRPPKNKNGPGPGPRKGGGR